jgi:hypothetical protein
LTDRAALDNLGTSSERRKMALPKLPKLVSGVRFPSLALP